MTHPRAGETYRPKDYWAGLHDSAEDLGIVGHPTMPLIFNRYLYANAAHSVLRALDVRGRTVLDVGSGTGFWVDLWLREGAAKVCGSDLVATAVERLRERFPQSEFAVADIAEQPPFLDSTFDVVTIMSVLHHVIEDARFRAALRNLASQLAPGGRIAVLDPLVVRGRWMPPSMESAHNVVRTLPQWQSALDDAGLRVAAIEPTAWFFSDPVDAGSKAAFTAHRYVWRGLGAALKGRDRLASLVVPPVAALDREVTSRLRTGPSSKLLLLARAD